jgi:hypothetical protein
LVIDGKIYRNTTGDNTKVFKWNGWDVYDLIGKKVYLEIVDNNPDTTNAFTAIDHIMFSDKLTNQQLNMLYGWIMARIIMQPAHGAIIIAIKKRIIRCFLSDGWVTGNMPIR